MLIHLSELSQAEGKRNSVDIQYGRDVITVGDTDYDIIQKDNAQFLMSCPKKGFVHIEGEYSLQAVAPCDRCLKDVTVPVSVSIEEDVDVGEMGAELDTDELLYKEILMKWPMKVLCQEECKGICIVCGKDLNEGECGCDRKAPDPRMMAILDVFNNSMN